MTTDKCKSVASSILFRLGQVLFVAGVILFVIAIFTTHWVVRPTVDYDKHNIQANETLVTKHFGIFLACRQFGSLRNIESQGRRSQGGSDQCGSLWDNLNFVDTGAIRFIQFLMIVAGMLYVLSISLEIVQFLPIQKFRNFLAENRVVEMFGGIATVIVLTGMVIFAGEVKNKAERVPGQEDEQSGWSFIIAMKSLLLCIFGLVTVTMFRELPIHVPGRKGGTWLRVADNRPVTID